jgi:mono/diheme cytochrome c family protein
LLGLSLLVLVSCKREEQGPPQPGPGTDNLPPGFPPMPRPPVLEETEPHAAGKKVYNANGCARCHTMGGTQAGPPIGGPPPGGPPMGGPPMGGPPMGGPPMPNKGPDLAKVASKGEKRDVEWFIAYVSNPKKTNPEARMPPFEKQIKEKDMRALAEFLASLK